MLLACLKVLVIVLGMVATVLLAGWLDIVELPHPMPTVFFILSTKAQIAVPPIINTEGQVEVFDGVRFTHHFVHVDKTIRSAVATNVTFHYVEVGSPSAEPVVFLHGIPDTWFLWHKQMVSLCGGADSRWRCLSFDVKGYGQSSRPLCNKVWPDAAELGGNYDRSVVADELVTALEQLNIRAFNLVSLDLSSWQAPIMAGEWNDRVLRYCKAQSTVGVHDKKHVPQVHFFRNIPRLFTAVMEYNPAAMVKILHGKTGRPALARHRRTVVDLPDDVHERALREFALPNNYRSWAGFYNTLPDPADVTSSQTAAFRNYTFPTLLLQGYHDPAQPPEYYDGSRVLDCWRQFSAVRGENISLCDVVDVPAGEGRVDPTAWFPNAPWVKLVVVGNAGHYIPHEQPEQVTAALREWLEVAATKTAVPPPLAAGKIGPVEWMAYYDSVAFKHHKKIHPMGQVYLHK